MSSDIANKQASLFIDDEPQRQKTGKELKEEGMSKASGNRKALLSEARAIALLLADDWKTISIEDVRDYYAAHDRPFLLWNAAGSVFRGNEWVWVGFSVAKHPAAHARVVRTWRRKF
jgi:hypothetical protein